MVGFVAMFSHPDVALAAGRLRTRASIGTSRLMGTSAFLAVSLFSVHQPVNG